MPLLGDGCFTIRISVPAGDRRRTETSSMSVRIRKTPRPDCLSRFSTVTNQGGQLKLLNLTKKVHDLLQITKLYTVFEVHDDETTGIRSFS